MMKQTCIVLGLVLALASGCSKDKDKAGGGGGGAASNKPLEMTAPDLWADYTSDKYKGLELLDRYRPGVKVTGKVKDLGGDGDPSATLLIRLDVDGQKWIDLQFMPDEPGFAPARAKGVKEGDQVTALCDVGGRTDNYLLLIRCNLQ